MNTVTLIANTGVQTMSFRVGLKKRDGFCKYFYEWKNPINDKWYLDAVYRLEEQNGDELKIAYYYLRPLIENGWFAPGQPISMTLLKQNGIKPIFVEGEKQENGRIVTIDFDGFANLISHFENIWLPLPYFYQRRKQNGNVLFRTFGPLNWSRCKLIPRESTADHREYDVTVAFDTRALDKESVSVVEEQNHEFPLFADSSVSSLEFGLCQNELFLLDYVSSQLNCSYIYEYLLHILHPETADVNELDSESHRYSFVTTYLFLIDLLLAEDVLPTVKLIKNTSDDARPVDMVVSVSADSATALVMEDEDFNTICPVRTSYKDDNQKYSFDLHDIDMTADYGSFGAKRSEQFKTMQNNSASSRASQFAQSLANLFLTASKQINGDAFRQQGNKEFEGVPRSLRNVIFTTPSALLKVDRTALLNNAKDAKALFEKQTGNSNLAILPQLSPNADEKSWNYDESTCIQMVYLYSELGFKYKECVSEFFKLYQLSDRPLTIGSVNIDDATVDMLVNEYSFTNENDSLELQPKPLFYDTFQQASDSMLKGLIQALLDNEKCPLRKKIGGNKEVYQKFLHDFFGKSNEQIAQLQTDFTKQYLIPIASYYIDLLQNNSCNCTISYADVFATKNVSQDVVEGFKSYVKNWLAEKGEKSATIDITKLEWNYDSKQVAAIVRKEFEPLLKKIATIFHAFACDVILLNGKAAHLQPVREIFLKYYAVSPDRLITMSDYFAGTWYPFAQSTGYINDTKTVVPVGAFLMTRLSKAKSGLRVNQEALKDIDSFKSVQFVEESRSRLRVNYAFTPDQKQAKILASSFPITLKAKQMDADLYPEKALYVIDVNRAKVAEKLRLQARINREDVPSDEVLEEETKKFVQSMQERMPLTITISRRSSDKEVLLAGTVTDKDGVNVDDHNIEIQMKQCDANQNWKETGVYEF